MRVLVPEEFVSIQRGNVETLFALSNHAFQGVQKWIELNLRAVGSALEQGEASCEEALRGSSADALLLRQAHALQPAAEALLSYNRTILDLASRAQADLLEAAQARYEQFHRDVQAFVVGTSRHAPLGSEIAATLLRSAVSAASIAHDTARKAAAQAIIAGSGAAAAVACPPVAPKASAAQPAPAAQARRP